METMSESLGTETFEERVARLKELTEFTESCKKQIQELFEAMGWSPDQDPGQERMEQCPFNPDHWVPARSLEKHKASCHLRKMGYPAEEQAEMVDPSVCYENTSVRTFTMDKALQHQAILQARAAAPLMKMEGVYWQGQFTGQPVDVPQNHKRAVCDLTPADRLALYDHAIRALDRRQEDAANDDLYVDLVSKLQKGEEQKEPKTHLELMAEMRDYKRRRQSYRAKNVHITKKSYTEVIREVISVHSEELARQWKEDEEEEEEEAPAQRSSHRRRSLSTESRRSHGRRHRSREGSPEREEGRGRRRRASRSPDEHRHDRKKKKKKKKRKDERERSRSDSG